ncbi:MAG: rhodanese family protein [Legionellales bacterium]|nr:rhodanese family protein [Legionellales bacterium]
MSELILLTDEELKKLIAENPTAENIQIIDIRDADEYAREHIPGSQNIPISQLSQVNLTSAQNKIVIFYCKLGNRTRAQQQRLSASGLSPIYCLSGGIEQWKRCGFAVVANPKAPLEIMRQVQIIAGSLMLLGIILAYSVATIFIFLSVFVGVGLIIAGVSGFCGMAKLLMYMPWNKSNCILNKE